jgi:hypothetical protein
MKGGPTSASTGSPLARPTSIPGTPRFVWFIALLSGPGLTESTSPVSPEKLVGRICDPAIGTDYEALGIDPADSPEGQERGP